MKKLFYGAAALALLIGFTSVFVSCGSSSSPSSPSATATPTAVPPYSSAPAVFASAGVAPYSLAYDSFSVSGNIWFIADTNPGSLSQYTAAGSLFNSSTYYSGISQYNLPRSVRTAPDGYLYISDTGNNQIEVMNSAGSYTQLGPSVISPSDTAVNAAGTSLVVLEASSPNVSLLTYSITGTGYPKTYNPVLSSFPNGGTPATGDPAQVTSMALDSTGNIYLCDLLNRQIIKCGPGGGGGVTFIAPGNNYPFGMAFDSAGNLFVIEQATQNYVQEYSSTGSAGISIGGFPASANLAGITVDASGNLFVSNTTNAVIYKISK
jgi:streptogramin lyase